MNIRQYMIVLLIFFSLSTHAQNTQVRHFPTPETVSTQILPLVSGEPASIWNDHPKTNQEWKNWVNQFAQHSIQQLPALRKQMQVTVEPVQFGGINGFIITPKQTRSENKNRVLLHFHGGGYVLNPGEAGTDEAILMAGFGQIKVISIDYRMPPDFPFPAAIDDAVAAYREILKHYPANKIGVFGTSTGGGITLALMLKAKAESLPLPAAIVVGTPWTDLSKTGDSYFTHEGIDNVLVSYDGWLGDAAKLYANGEDLKDPLLSPIYGDVTDFPPTLLFSGTRDLFLSNTVRMHLKLRDAGVTADLIVLEGLSHAQYLMVPDAPETKRYFNESSRFFNHYLAQ
ncbi:alpha/beta hydrolase [Entomomonas sp. E2T0]|uniref:alpha/beta hydrolase n=1 Tax=Entomomonas sp. E2T0 TaxID=2930213 RepID=UPI0022282703|nr:alpha/beta hydrolase [Entomomonas sp. E2T0]UYZ82728.1 alpha/beta hydrolase [Entomomonas sp. E2T0]